MKLLFDQNISPRIVKQLSKSFTNSTKVRYVGLQDSSNIKIFDFARENDYAIVTFDSDFVDLNLVKGIPPKIIWIKSGNLSTKSISDLLNKNINQIKEFLYSGEHEILELIS